MPDSHLIYWDSCAFLSYINEHPQRIAHLDAVLEEIEKGDGGHLLVTSTLTKAEVAYGADEKTNHQLDPDTEDRINALWLPGGPVTFVEFHSDIADRARNLMRVAVQRQWKLTPLDAVHLATAEWVDVDELHTYDGNLAKLATLIGCLVCEPYALQTKLPSL